MNLYMVSWPSSLAWLSCTLTFITLSFWNLSRVVVLKLLYFFLCIPKKFTYSYLLFFVLYHRKKYQLLSYYILTKYFVYMPLNVVCVARSFWDIYLKSRNWIVFHSVFVHRLKVNHKNITFESGSGQSVYNQSIRVDKLIWVLNSSALFLTGINFDAFTLRGERVGVKKHKFNTLYQPNEFSSYNKNKTHSIRFYKTIK